MGLLLLNLKTGTSRWSEDPSKKLIDQKSWSKIAALAGFTDRELEVSRLIFQGKTRNDVAELLGITGRTVRQHMENLYEKLNVSTRVGFVLRLIQIRDHICK